MNNIITIVFLFLTLQIGLSQTKIDSFFNEVDSFMSKYVQAGAVDYMNIKAGGDLQSLVQTIENTDFRSLDTNVKKAYLINVYNLIVINEAVKAYPIASVQDISGFFDRKRVIIGNKDYTLTDFEKKEILDEFDDPRLHFVLVCGAVGCPPITNFAYLPQSIDEQIDIQTKSSLNDPNFIRTLDDQIELSQIFRWYASDFGNSKSSILAFINTYRQEKLNTKNNLDYYPYDWTLNAASTSSSGPGTIATNASRYIVSSTIPKGQIELKIFNNLYSQIIGGESRSSFFTTQTSFLYGINKRFNLGFNTSYRRVLNSESPSSPFDVLGRPNSGQFRQGITAFGPQIRWAAVPKWQNFSIQSRLVFPIGRNLSGGNGEQYIDWQGPSLFNQFFNDKAIGTRFSLFTEIGLHWEDIGRLSNGRINQVSTPLTAILSFSPTRKAIIYALGGFSPFYRIPFDYFLQGGLGGKYQFTRNVELELLYTGFTNKFLLQNDGGAATYNIGFRFNI
jgi:hypothetical protein